MAAEAALAIGAGIAARSVLLTAFGFDSVIELLSGVTLLWRLSSEARGAPSARMESIERRATVISAALLVLLSVYLVIVGLGGVVARLHPEGSALGVGVAPLAWRTTAVAKRPRPRRLALRSSPFQWRSCRPIRAGHGPRTATSCAICAGVSRRSRPIGTGQPRSGR